MPVNIVIYGDEEIINLTDATATEDTILKGSKAYGSKGQLIQGKALGFSAKLTTSVTAPSNPKVGDLWVKQYSSQKLPYRFITTEGLSIPKDIASFTGIVVTGILLGNLTDMQSAYGEDGVSNFVLDGDNDVSLFFKATGAYSGAYDVTTTTTGWYPAELYVFDGITTDWTKLSDSDEGYITVRLTDTSAHGFTCWIENKETGIIMYAPFPDSNSATFAIPFAGDWIVNCVYNNKKLSQTISAEMEDEATVRFTFE